MSNAFLVLIDSPSASKSPEKNKRNVRFWLRLPIIHHHTHTRTHKEIGKTNSRFVVLLHSCKYRHQSCISAVGFPPADQNGSFSHAGSHIRGHQPSSASRCCSRQNSGSQIKSHYKPTSHRLTLLLAETFSKSAAVCRLSLKFGPKWTFVFLPMATLLLRCFIKRIYSPLSFFFLGSSQKTTGSDVWGLFSPLESSYLGPSVGGELRCVK